jgi:pimeloyl-ACP methyl ester carboxylesterase
LRRAAKRAKTEEGMPFAQMNCCCKLYYESTGHGPDMVFIHGEDHGLEMFEQQVSYFAPHYRCLTYYRRGHGRSQLAPYGYSLHCQTLDLAQLLDHLQIERAVILAVAMATTIAVNHALQYPERVRALVLASWYELDGYPLMEERRARKYSTTFAQLHMQMFEIIRDGGQQGLIDHMEKERDAFLPILPRDSAVRARVMRMMASHSPEHYIRAAEFYTSMPNLVPRLAEIRCPVLGICGEDDPCPDDPQLLAGSKSFKQTWIPAARRFTMMEAAPAFNSVLEQFLGSLR